MTTPVDNAVREIHRILTAAIEEPGQAKEPEEAAQVAADLRRAMELVSAQGLDPAIRYWVREFVESYLARRAREIVDGSLDEKMPESLLKYADPVVDGAVRRLFRKWVVVSLAASAAAAPLAWVGWSKIIEIVESSVEKSIDSLSAERVRDRRREALVTALQLRLGRESLAASLSEAVVNVQNSDVSPLESRIHLAQMRRLRPLLGDGNTGVSSADVDELLSVVRDEKTEEGVFEGAMSILSSAYVRDYRVSEQLARMFLGDGDTGWLLSSTATRRRARVLDALAAHGDGNALSNVRRSVWSLLMAGVDERLLKAAFAFVLADGDKGAAKYLKAMGEMKQYRDARVVLAQLDPSSVRDLVDSACAKGATLSVFMEAFRMLPGLAIARDSDDAEATEMVEKLVVRAIDDYGLAITGVGEEMDASLSSGDYMEFIALPSIFESHRVRRVVEGYIRGKVKELSVVELCGLVWRLGGMSTVHGDTMRETLALSGDVVLGPETKFRLQIADNNKASVVWRGGNGEVRRVFAGQSPILGLQNVSLNLGFSADERRRALRWYGFE